MVIAMDIEVVHATQSIGHLMDTDMHQVAMAVVLEQLTN